MGVRMAKAFLSLACALTDAASAGWDFKPGACVPQTLLSWGAEHLRSRTISWKQASKSHRRGPSPLQSHSSQVPANACSSAPPPRDPSAFVSEPTSGGRSRAEGRPGLGKGGKQGNPLTIQRSHQTGGEGPSCAFGSPGGPAQGTRAWAPRSAGQRGRWSLASGEVTRGGDVAKDIPAPRLQAPSSSRCALLSSTAPSW